ncbi:hypothetical protein O6H91_09G029500 [Diphasiastrum complanatum]|nr:hypothetical protein O6H91_09G029500 [Diphasiastrum complanatum]
MAADKETNLTSKEEPGGPVQIRSIASVNVSAAEGEPIGAVDGAPLGIQVQCLIVLEGSEQVKACKIEDEKNKDEQQNEKGTEQLVDEIEEQGQKAESRGAGEGLKGRKMKKKFGRKNYMGEVTAYDAENRWYHIDYEDGDEEDLSWPELEPVLLP